MAGRFDSTVMTVYAELCSRFGAALAGTPAQTLTRLRLLLELDACGGLLYAGDLASRLLMDPSSVSSALKAMERAGQVSRGADPLDRRSVRVGVTAGGLDALSASSEAVFGVMEAAWSGLTAQEVDLIYENTRCIAPALSGYTYVDAAGPVKPCYLATVASVTRLVEDLADRSYAMSLTQARCLLLMLCTETPLSGKEIAQTLILKPPVVSRATTFLEGAGLVCRTRNTGDRRVESLALTDAGAERAVRLDADASELLGRLYALTPEVLLPEISGIAAKIYDTLRAD